MGKKNGGRGNGNGFGQVAVSEEAVLALAARVEQLAGSLNPGAEEILNLPGGTKVLVQKHRGGGLQVAAFKVDHPEPLRGRIVNRPPRADLPGPDLDFVIALACQAEARAMARTEVRGS